RSLGHGGEMVQPRRVLTDDANRADAPADVRGPARRAMEGVELALVQHVREDLQDLLLRAGDVDQPDLVPVRPLDRGPTEQTGLTRERLRRSRGLHVETVGSA